MSEGHTRRWVVGATVAAAGLVALVVLLVLLISTAQANRNGHRGLPLQQAESVLHLHSDGATAVVTSPGAVWVAGFGVVRRIDPVSLRVTATISTPATDGLTQMAVAGGSLWITGDRGKLAGNSGTLYRIDLSTKQVTATLHIGGIIDSLAVSGGIVAVSGTNAKGNPVVVEVSETRNSITRSVANISSGQVRSATGLFYTIDTAIPPLGSRLYSFSPAGGAPRGVDMRARIDLPMPPIAIGGGYVWTIAGGVSYPPVVTAIDPQTGRVAVTRSIPRAQAVAAGNGMIWVMTMPKSSTSGSFNPIPGTAQLWSLNAKTGRSTHRPYPLRGVEQPYSVVIGKRHAWVTDYLLGNLVRVSLAGA
ncbi:MAG: NHL repeat-containing protein [Acidimicrobiales bacterium]